MHVAQHAGSHVVVRREKNNPWPSKEILVKAASIAAWFSKARHATSAEVHVTEKRFVRKPHGAPGGTVIAERCKTIRVAPRSPREILPKNDFLADTGDSEAGWG
jgi:predicted ribosome quality control (RQC) complex YloA/Tae2 family protein